MKSRYLLSAAASTVLAACWSAATSQAATIAWTEAGTETAWYTATNWTPNTASGDWMTSDIAQFNNTGTAGAAGIDMSTASLSIGAIEVTSLRTRALTVLNSSTTGGTLTLSGATVNGVANTVIRNASNSTLTFSNAPNTMGVVLAAAGNNKIVIDADGARILMSSAISGAGGIEMIRNAGSSRLDFGGNNTYDGDLVLTSGRMRVLSAAGGNAIPNGPGKGNVVFNGDSTTQLGLQENETINGLSGGAGSGFIGNDDSNSTNTLTVGDGDATASFGGIIINESSGANGLINLVKIGGGVQTLSGPNTYTGTTTINGGTLLVNGMHVGSHLVHGSLTGAYTVNSGGTLGGTGSTGGAVTVNADGFLAPGASIGTFGVGSATGAGKLMVEYDGDVGADLIDLLNVAGDFDITSMTVDFDLLPLGDPLDDVAIVFAKYGSLIGTAFASELDTPAGYTIDYAYNDGSSANNIALVVVPEPFAAALATLGALGLYCHRRQRRRF
jgi:autotransporter-associated beta strand protein